MVPYAAGLEAASLDACLKCSLCTAACPVMRVMPAFPGPKRLGPDAERWRLELGVPSEPLAAECLGCRQCEQACPAGVPIAHLISRARAAFRAAGGGSLRDRLVARVDLTGRFGSLLPGLANRMAGLRPVRRTMEWALGIDARRPLPRFAHRPFRAHRRHRPAPGAPGPGGPAGAPGRAVVLFVGCYARHYDPDLADAVIEVLEHNGFRVIIPPQDCCGQPLLANGFPDAAAAKARYNIGQLGPWARAGVPVVVASSSCALTLQSDYRELAGDAAAELGAGVRELGDFLRELWENGELRLDFGPVDEQVAHHAPCHLRAMGTGRPFAEVLRLVPGLRVAELDEGCCGMAGTHGARRAHLDLSLAIGRPLFDQARALGARVVTECETCKLQFEFGAGVEVIHPVKLLRAAYRAGQQPRA